MARFDFLSSGLMSLRDPMEAFDSFLQMDENGYQDTELGKEFDDDNNPRNVTCYLDYMFVWLAEGDGALYCATFEDWLLAIIRFADDLYSPRARKTRDTSDMGTGPLESGYWGARTSLTMGLLDWGAASRDEKLNEQYVEAIHNARSWVTSQRPADEEGMRHPALDRNIYERCRVRASERLRKRELESLAEKLNHKKM